MSTNSAIGLAIGVVVLIILIIFALNLAGGGVG